MKYEIKYEPKYYKTIQIECTEEEVEKIKLIERTNELYELERKQLIKSTIINLGLGYLKYNLQYCNNKLQSYKDTK